MGNWFSKHAQQSRLLTNMPLITDMTKRDGPKSHGGEHRDDDLTDEENSNFKSDMGGNDMINTAGTFNTTVGLRGNNPQQVGNNVSGSRTNLASPDKRYTAVKGKVVGPSTNKKASDQERSVKGVNFTFDDTFRKVS